MNQLLMKNKPKHIDKENVVGTLFAMIPVFGFLIFGLIPMLLAIMMSFMKVQGYSFDNSVFYGFTNYIDILKDPTFYQSLLRTFYAGLGLPVSIALSLVIAQFINTNKWGTKVFRVIFFLPYVCSVVAITTMWKWLYDYNFGILNSIMRLFGSEPIPWITDSTYFMPSMIIMGIWSGLGFNIILFSASLGNVPKSYYEAAKLDGAGRIKIFFSVTVPCISPTLFFIVTMGLIGMLQDFTRFQIMGGDNGGPNEAGLTSVFYLWRMGFKNVLTEGMGKASAASLLLAVVIILVTRVNFWLSKLWVHDEQ